MSTVYAFSVSEGFATTNNTTLINTDIDGQIATRTSTVILGDTINITFSAPLSDSDAVIVHNIIKQYDLIIQFKSPTVRISSMALSNKNTAYTVIYRFMWHGSEKLGNITKIEFIGYMDVGATNYSVRLINRTTGLTMVENSYTNTTVAPCDLGTITNVSTTSSIIEIQVKRAASNASKLNYMDELLIYTDK